MPSTDASAASSAIFSPYELDRLDAIQRFLVNVTDPDIAARAAKLGYDAAEHQAGWTDWATAAGMHVPFAHHLSEAEQRVSAAGSSATAERIRALDRFENTWHPRARNAIRRFVAPAAREAFEAAFFEDMPQQPESPAVVGSVAKLLPRLESMRTSPVEGAAAAYEALVKKGLTKSAIKAAQTLLDAAQAEAHDLPAPTVSPDEVAKSARARREAYDRLNLWYIDWGDVFRGELGYHALVRLGLTAVKGGRKATPDEPAPVETPGG